MTVLSRIRMDFGFYPADFTEWRAGGRGALCLQMRIGSEHKADK
ncbi:hypothetical protein OKW40_000678 [Paraburkholderia sp. RAU6.4a]